MNASPQDASTQPTPYQSVQETRMIWATALCFVLGAALGTIALCGMARPLAGDGSVSVRAATIAGAIAAATFVVSTFLHRRGETLPMPRWQAVISNLSAIALTIAFAGVTALGVLLASEVLGVGLRGLELPPLSGGLLTGAASAVGGRLAFDAGVGLRTSDLARLLFAYLVIGTLFAMLTAADPLWWERNFSQLGVGTGSWVFNGTLIVAGLLIATVGSYIGRDLHRILGDAALGKIAWMVVLWSATGMALAGVGLISVDAAPLLHTVTALTTLGLFVIAVLLTTIIMPGPPREIVVATVGLTLLVIGAVVLREVLHLFTVTALEAIVVGLGILWMTTFVQKLAALAPSASRPSARSSLVHE